MLLFKSYHETFTRPGALNSSDHTVKHGMARRYRRRVWSQFLLYLSEKSYRTEHWFASWLYIQWTRGISNTFISKYLLISKNSVNTRLFFLYSSAPFISNYRYLKVNFLGPENLLWDISSFEWTSISKYRRLTVWKRNIMNYNKIQDVKCAHVKPILVLQYFITDVFNALLLLWWLTILVIVCRLSVFVA